ncbi:MAG: sulfurtransferase TusA family protein [Candidatus Hydrothermarchaeales archaeon]
MDTIGLLCPMPIVELSRKMEELKSGEVLELLADDEGAKKDVPAWCSSTGNEYLGMEEGGCLRFYIKKK